MNWDQPKEKLLLELNEQARMLRFELAELPKHKRPRPWQNRERKRLAAILRRTEKRIELVQQMGLFRK